MKRKIFLILAAMITVMALACGCSNLSDITTDDTSSSKTDDTSASKNEGKKTSKRKYDNINADSTPVGIDEVEFNTDKDGYTILYQEGYKNSSDIEESLIEVTFELYDENNKYICEKTVATEKSLTEGESERFSEDIIWEAPDYKKDVPDETLAMWTVKIVDIEETDAVEVAAAEELENTIQDIRIAIECDEEYNKAQILLDSALQKYPDNTDLKLLQAELTEALSAEQN